MAIPLLPIAALGLRAAPMIGRGVRAGYGGVRGLLGRQSVMRPTQYSGNANFGVPSLLNSGRANVPALRPKANVPDILRPQTNIPNRPQTNIPNASAGGNNFVNSLIGRINRNPKKSALGALALGGAGEELRQMAFPGGSVASTVDSGVSARDRGAPTGNFGNIPPSERNLQAANQMQDMSAATSSDGTSEDDEDNDFISNLSGLFSDNDRLAKLAMGVALLEGQPIEDAVNLSNVIRTGGVSSGGKVNVEIVDKESNAIIDYGNSDDAKIKDYLKNPARYEIYDLGGFKESNFKETSAMSDAIAKKGADYLDELVGKSDDAIFREPIVKKFLSALESGDLSTGSALESVKVDLAKTLGLDPDVSDEELFEAFNTQLTVDIAQGVKGALSEKELALFQASQPSLSLTADANRRLLERSLALGRIYDAKTNFIEESIFERNNNYIVARREFNEQFKNNKEFRKDVLGVQGVIDNAAEITENLSPGEYYWNNTDDDFSYELPNGQIQTITYGNFFTIT
jgi:hypothetical protein